MAAVGVKVQPIVMVPPDGTYAIGLLEHGNVEPRRAHRRGAGEPGGTGADDDGLRGGCHAISRSAREKNLLPPHLIGDIDGKLQLRPLLLFGEDVAFFGRSEAALRRYRKLLQGYEFGGLLQPPLDVVFVLELAEFGGDDADHHDLVAVRKEAQRLEAAGAV